MEKDLAQLKELWLDARAELDAHDCMDCFHHRACVTWGALWDVSENAHDDYIAELRDRVASDMRQMYGF